ncbi:unnamed protein product [Prunus armeniaca]
MEIKERREGESGAKRGESAGRVCMASMVVGGGVCDLGWVLEVDGGPLPREEVVGVGLRCNDPPLSLLSRDGCNNWPRFGLSCTRPTTKVDGAGTKMTGPPSSSNPSQAPPLTAVISPEKRREMPGFARNFADFDLSPPASIFGNPGMEIHLFLEL